MITPWGLPDSFVSTIRSTFKNEGREWLEALPSLVKDISSKWGLDDVRPVNNLSYNFVAFARRADENVVLKAGVPRDELFSEMAALRLFNGQGACRLLEYDQLNGVMLLERLFPGQMLSELDDDRATGIAADVMSTVWRPAPDDKVFIRLADWFDGFHEMRSRFNGATGPLKKHLVELAEGIVRDFFRQDDGSVLMHGDFHHFNVLSSTRGWLVIDPKGVIGPRGYEVGPYLLNPWNESMDRGRLKVQTERRMSIFSERLGFRRDEIIKWGIAHAVLSAWWGVEDDTGWEYAMMCAETFTRCS